MNTHCHYLLTKVEELQKIALQHQDHNLATVLRKWLMKAAEDNTPGSWLSKEIPSEERR